MKNAYLEDDFEHLAKIQRALKFNDVFGDEMKNLTKWDKMLETQKEKGLNTIEEGHAKSFFENTFSAFLDLHLMRFLNIPHPGLDELLGKFYSLFIKNNYRDWNTRILPGFDLLGYKRLDQMNLDLMSTGKKSSEKYHPLLKNFMKSVRILYALDRTGFSIPGYSLQKHITPWLSRIRKFYPSYKKMDDETTFLIARCAAVILDHLSDHGLYRLKKDAYAEEYEFFMNTIQTIVDEAKAGTVGEVLHGWKIIEAEVDFKAQKKLREAEFFIAFRQFKDGGWRNDAKIVAMLDTKNAIVGLLNHQPSKHVDTDVGEFVAYSKYHHDALELGYLTGENRPPTLDQEDVTKFLQTLEHTPVPQ